MQLTIATSGWLPRMMKLTKHMDLDHFEQFVVLLLTANTISDRVDPGIGRYTSSVSTITHFTVGNCISLYCNSLEQVWELGLCAPLSVCLFVCLFVCLVFIFNFLFFPFQSQDKNDYNNILSPLISTHTPLISTHTPLITTHTPHNDAYPSHNDTYPSHNDTYPSHNRTYSSHNRTYSSHSHSHSSE